MPRITLPTGEVKYYSTLEELNEAHPDPQANEGVELDQKVDADTTVKTETKPVTSEEKDVDTEETKKSSSSGILGDLNPLDKQDKPGWFLNGVKALAHMPVQIADMSVSTWQQMAQTNTMPSLHSFATAYAGGDPMNLYATRAAMTKSTRDKYDDAMGIGNKEAIEKDKLRVERGSSYALAGLQDPAATGGELKRFGIDKDLPIVGALGKGGSWYEATKPEGDIANFIADAGSVVLMSLGGSPGRGLTPTKAPNIQSLKGAIKLRNLDRAGWRKFLPNTTSPLGFKGKAAFDAYWKNWWKNGVHIAKRVGADLPEDFIDEATLLGNVELGFNQQEELDKYIETASTAEKEALKNGIEARTQASADYWLAKAFQISMGTAGSAAFRWTLGGFNQNFRLFRAKAQKGLKTKDMFTGASGEKLKKLARPYLEKQGEVNEKAVGDVENAITDASVRDLNNDFTTGVREGFEIINGQVDNINSLRASIKKAETDQKLLDTSVTSLSALPPEAMARYNALPDLIEARQKSIGSLKRIGKNKRTNKQNVALARYEKQFKAYTKELKALEDELQSRGTSALGLNKSAIDYATQSEKLYETLEHSIEDTIKQFDMLMTYLSKVDGDRQGIAKDMDLSNDPYYQSYSKVKELFEQYKNTDDPDFERQLLDAIQQEFKVLTDVGGARPIRLPVETRAEVEAQVPEQVQKLDPIDVKDRQAEVSFIKGAKSEAAKELKKRAREFGSRYGRKYEEVLNALSSNQSQEYISLMEEAIKYIPKAKLKKIDLGTLRSISQLAKRASESSGLPYSDGKPDSSTLGIFLTGRNLDDLLKNVDTPDGDVPPTKGKGGPELPKVPTEGGDAPSPDADAPKSEGEAIPNPWDDPDTPAVKQGPDGSLEADPDAKGEPISYTEDAPETAAQQRLRAELELGLRPDLKEGETPVSSVDEWLEKGTTKQAGQDFIDMFNEISLRIEQGIDTGYDWSDYMIRALERSIGELDTPERRATALNRLFGEIVGKPDSFLPKAQQLAIRWVGRLVGVEGEFKEYYKQVQRHVLSTKRSEVDLQRVQTQMMTTPIMMYSLAQRIYFIMDKLKSQNLTAAEAGIYRQLAADEAWMLYNQTAVWMKLRTYTSGALQAQSAKQLAPVQQAYINLRGKKAQVKAKQATDADVEQIFEDSIANVKELQAQLAEEALNDIPTYLGLPSHLANIEEILNKFRDPKFVPNADELDVFNKVTHQLASAGLNPGAISSIRISGDEIVGRLIKSFGLSNPATQTSFIPQTIGYGIGQIINGVSQGRLNKFWDMFPWLKDDEATQYALKQSRIWGNFWKAQSNISGDILQNVYMTRKFGRSWITDAAAPLDNTGKYSTSPRARDPIREAEILRTISNTKPFPDRGIGKWLNDMFGQKAKGHIISDLMNLHDLTFRGDAYKAQGEDLPGRNNTFGKFNKTMGYDYSVTGLRDSILNRTTGGGLSGEGQGLISPRQSKLPGGERVGATLPLVSSETSTELVGGYVASNYSKAMAWTDVIDMVDGGGRPLYTEYDPDGSLNKAFLAKVQEVYHDKYTKPVVVGMGDSSKEIARALAHKDAQKIALSMDMMMSPEDDLWGGITGAIQGLHRGDNGESRVLAQAFWPYIKAPLNGHKHHFYHSQPEPFSQAFNLPNIPGLPNSPFVPMGAFIEGTVGIQRLIQSWDGKVMGLDIGSDSAIRKAFNLDYRKEKDLLSKRLGWFKSQVFHEDVATRASARSSLATATALNWGVMSLVQSGQLEVTGGQVGSYQEANGAYIPAYHMKIKGHWVPYRWLPYIGELLAFSANFREFSRHEVNFNNSASIGTAIVATAATFADTPAMAGIDTLITALSSPHKAEDAIVDYIEKTMGAGFTPGWYAVQRLITEAYNARPLSGSRADVLFKGKGKLWEKDQAFEETGSIETWLQNVSTGASGDSVIGIPSLAVKTVSRISNNMGLLPLVESMDQATSEYTGKHEGDFRQAHWYKPGDVTYRGPRQRSVFGTILGRHFPVPDDSDVVDIELFRNGIKPPNQVFTVVDGMVGNETMINRFRRYLGSEFKFANGDSLHERFRQVIEGQRHIPGHPNKYYNELEDDPKNVLTLDGNYVPWFKRKDVYTKRDALMKIRAAAINKARYEFLSGQVSHFPTDGTPNFTTPTEITAPRKAQEAYQMWNQKKANRPF